MFERFTNEARDVVVGAQNEARGLGHRYIGTEHLLLSLLHPKRGAAGAILADAGVTAERVRADLQRLLGEPRLGQLDAAALEAIGIDLDAVRAKIEETFGPGALDPPPPARRRGRFRRQSDPDCPPTGHIPFTARSKKVLELSLREAVRFKHRFIGSEHILLGLLREGGGLAAKVLVDGGVNLDDLRHRAEESLRQAA